MRWLDDITDSDMNLSRLQGIVKNSEAWHAVVHGVTKSRDTAEQLTSDYLLCTLFLWSRKRQTT